MTRNRSMPAEVTGDISDRSNCSIEDCEPLLVADVAALASLHALVAIVGLVANTLFAVAMRNAPHSSGGRCLAENRPFLVSVVVSNFLQLLFISPLATWALVEPDMMRLDAYKLCTSGIMIATLAYSSNFSSCAIFAVRKLANLRSLVGCATVGGNQRHRVRFVLDQRTSDCTPIYVGFFGVAWLIGAILALLPLFWSANTADHRLAVFVESTSICMLDPPITALLMIVIGNGVPVALTAVSYLFIVSSVKWRSLQSRHKRFMISFFVALAADCLLCTPLLVTTLAERFGVLATPVSSRSFKFAGAVFEVLACSKAFVNVFLYGFLNGTGRNAIPSSLCRCCVARTELTYVCTYRFDANCDFVEQPQSSAETERVVKLQRSKEGKRIRRWVFMSPQTRKRNWQEEDSEEVDQDERVAAGRQLCIDGKVYWL